MASSVQDLSPNSGQHHQHHELSTTAVTRSLDDLHLPTWFGLQAVTISLRTAFLHPLSMAASRKRISHAPDTSVRRVLSEARQGGADGSRGGVRGVYRGFGVAVSGNILGEIATLWVVEAAKQRLLTLYGCDPHNPSAACVHSAQAIAGMCGDLASIALTTPLSIVCDRQLTARYGMAKGNPYQNAVQTFRTVLCGASPPGTRVSWRLGLGNLYAGAPASLAMLPAAGVWWSSYTEAKFRLYQWLGPWFRQFQAKSGRHSEIEHSGVRALGDTNWLISSTDNPLINGASGIIASALTSFVFTPLVVVRTRLQVTAPNPDSKQWRITQIAGRLFREEGLRGFYRGTFMNIAMAVLDGLAFSTLYEINKLGSDKALR
jgi:hypothetical protein